MQQKQHKGRWVSMDVVRDGPIWRHTYQVEGAATPRKGESTLPTEDLVYAEIWEQAKAKIDREAKLHLPGQRVEVLLSDGMADVWYPGTVLAGGDVQLDEHQYDWPLDLLVKPADICEWRPHSGQTSP